MTTSRVFLLFFVLVLTLQASADPSPGLRKFGYRYFQYLPEEGNQVCSPLSIHAAFTMLALGSDEETREQAFRVLGIDNGGHRQYSNFLESLAPELGTFKVASSVWPDRRFSPLPSYVSQVRKEFRSEVKPLNFQKPEQARKTINSWVSKTTSEQIPELLPKGALDPGTSLVLSNAVYFRGSWNNPFAQRATRPGIFHSPEGDVEVPMMIGNVEANYFEDEDLQVVSLPYAKTSLAFAVVLPRQEADWKAVRRKIDASLLYQVAEDRTPTFSNKSSKITVQIPKFTLRRSSQPLPLLRQMGLTSLLGPDPNLSKLSEVDGLFVGDCFHEAVVELDEQGTVASAATAIMLTRSGSRTSLSVVINRPFYFTIYDTKTLVPVFVGQVTSPE